MMRRELESRLGTQVHDWEWLNIEFAYTWSPIIKGVGGKDQIAALMSYGDKNYTMHEINKLLPDAIKTAKAAGVNIDTRQELTEKYDVLNGLCFNFEPRTIGDVYADVAKALTDRDLLPDEYFSIASKASTDKWPARYRWIACYGVRGGSEGYYVHVDIILAEGAREMLFLGKTLREGKNGREYINAIANALTEIFES